MSDSPSSNAPAPFADLLPQAAAPYRVLARKYRPATFDDLIGQSAMVRTLTNAFESDRIPQAWVLTGVRGVGKTTTARILARALNYEIPGEIAKPTVHMPNLGVHCQAIIESRHVDVIEMDAASHNGVDDVRQINDAVRYAPVSARYKVYILDEVHMLSGAAFNALLKTLEEPPPHVKFVFATTEIRKVPVTVLSRCQRFDLRRVEASVLVQRLSDICQAEGVSAEADALAQIARAAEGSVRDALSLLDQAISHAAGSIAAENVRQMLGLADRARVTDLFAALMAGETATALALLREQYDAGADPAVMMVDLADFVHFVTRIKLVPTVADDVAFAEVERKRGREFAASLSIRVLSRVWQMLLKGITEVQTAAKPFAAAEMVIVRLAYASDLPAPEDVIRRLNDEGAAGTASSPTPRPSEPVPRRPVAEALRGVGATAAALAREPNASPAPRPQSGPVIARALARFEDLVALAVEKRDLTVKAALERDVRLVRFEDGTLEFALQPGASRAIVGDLARKLSDWTGRRWMVALSAQEGEPPIAQKAEAQREEFNRGVQAHPLVRSVLERFPGAEIVRVEARGEVEQAGSTGEFDADLPPLDPDDDDL